MGNVTVDPVRAKAVNSAQEMYQLIVDRSSAVGGAKAGYTRKLRTISEKEARVYFSQLTSTCEAIIQPFMAEIWPSEN